LFTNRYLDFSLVLATIITTLTNFIKPTSASEADATDLKGSGDLHEDSEDDKMTIESDGIAGQKGNYPPSSSVWNNEDDEIEEWSCGDMRLPKVRRAFLCLKGDFDGKFKQIWA
jgi:hypothetical protein